MSFSDFRISKKDIREDIYICPFVLEDIRRTNIPKGIYMSLTVHTGVCTPTHSVQGGVVIAPPLIHSGRGYTPRHRRARKERMKVNTK